MITGWNTKEKVETLKMSLKVGEKISSYMCSCSRYGNIVGEFLGLEEIGGYTMAKIYYPQIKEYSKYSNQISSSYNPYQIYEDNFEALISLNSIFVVEDQTKEFGSVLY